ncbi:hypothetical protein QMZ05_27650 [Bradyrhizobium sp. INPA03-11B]|uniref:hypothetical protein n=1 Tax=Bradyrhizobium sp. INPA03-11B TaxID=418598 RepID=UPI00338EDB77
MAIAVVVIIFMMALLLKNSEALSARGSQLFEESFVIGSRDASDGRHDARGLVGMGSDTDNRPPPGGDARLVLIIFGALSIAAYQGRCRWQTGSRELITCESDRRRRF